MLRSIAPFGIPISIEFSATLISLTGVPGRTKFHVVPVSPMASLILGLFLTLVILLATSIFFTSFFLLLYSCFFTLKFDITTVSMSANNSSVLFLMNYGEYSSSDSQRIL